MTPSARTKNAGQQLSRADELLQLIQMWLLAAAACMLAGIVISGSVVPLFRAWNSLPTCARMAASRSGRMFAA